MQHQTTDELLTELIRRMVVNPQSVCLSVVPAASGLIYRVTVPKTDLGLLIGKQGRTARSLRAILWAISSRSGLRAELDIVRSPED